MKVHLSLPASAATISAALEGLVALNYVLLGRMRAAPKLYRSRVRYVPEPRGTEKWQNAVQLLKSRKGDCEDLAAYRAAELRLFYGIPARAVAYRSGKRKFHAVVLYPSGELEDPSKRLGMPRGGVRR